jgi:adenylyltransferase/sulfurtransferase
MLAYTPSELREKLERGDDLLLLDVRMEAELAVVCLDGATHVPLHELEQNLDRLAPWRNREVVTVCHHGVRSAMAQAFLRARGFTNVKNLIGGIDAYAQQADPALARY